MGRLISIIRYLAVAIMALTASAAFADQFTINGSLSQGGTFKAVLTYDSSTPVSNMNGTLNWYGSVTSISYEIYDTSGNKTLSTSVVAPSDTVPGAQNTSNFTQDDPTHETVQWFLMVPSGSGAAVGFGDPNVLSGYPAPSDMAQYKGTFFFYDAATGQYGSGNVTDVSTGPVDTDGDGIPDNVDSCPNSNLSKTVTVNGVDSGVKNTLESDGCTLMDILGSATTPSEVAHVTNKMKAEGLITGAEKGKIQSAAGKGNK